MFVFDGLSESLNARWRKAPSVEARGFSKSILQDPKRILANSTGKISLLVFWVFRKTEENNKHG
jgi:hypothetical protein